MPWDGESALDAYIDYLAEGDAQLGAEPGDTERRLRRENREDRMAWNNGGGERSSANGKPKYQHKENRGSMFDNDHRTTDKHPDFTGSINVEGVVYWISGWTGMTPSNKRKLTLSVKRQEDRPIEREQAAARAPQRQNTRW